MDVPKSASTVSEEWSFQPGGLRQWYRYLLDIVAVPSAGEIDIPIAACQVPLDGDRFGRIVRHLPSEYCGVKSERPQEPLLSE